MDAAITFALKLTLWCAVPFLLYPLARMVSAAHRHVLLLTTMIGALALPAALPLIPELGPGWLTPRRALPVSSPVATAVRSTHTPAVAQRVDRAAAAPVTFTTSAAPTPGTPLGPLAVKPAEVAAAPADQGARAVAPAPRRVSTTAAHPAPAPRRPSPAWFIAAAWLLGTALALWRLRAHLAALRLLMSRARPIEDHTAGTILEGAARALRVARRPRLLESAEASVPLAGDADGGFIVLPPEWRRWSPARMKVVLLHELAHIKRGDARALLAAALIAAVYWWHPLLAALRSWSRRETERAADDLVLRAGEAPSSYAGELVSIARVLSPPQPALGVSPMIIRHSNLKARVLAILDPRRRRSPLTRRLALTVAGLALLALAPLAGLRLVASAEASTDTRVGPKPVELFLLAQRSQPDPMPQPRQSDHDIKHDDDYKGDKGDKSAWKRADSLYDDARYAEAAEAFAASAAAGHRAATSYYNAACSAALAGDSALAIDYLQRSIDAGWDDPDHLVEDSDLDSLRADGRFQAMVDAVFAAQGKTRSPIKGYRLRATQERLAHLRETASTNGKAWHKTGTNLLSMRQLADAEAALERAVELRGPAGEDSLYNLACTHALAGNPGAAVTALRRSVETGYGDVEHMLKDPDLASLHGSTGFDSVVALARDLDLDRFRDYAGHDHGKGHKHGKHKNKGHDEFDHGRWDEAIAFYRGWLADNGSSGRGWANLAWALHNSQQFGEAADAFSRAVDLGYRPEVNAYNVACGRARLGDTGAALDWLQRAVELGWKDSHGMERDADLASLHGEPRFRRMLWDLRDDQHYHHD